MHVGWAMVFDPLPGAGRPTVDQVREQLDARLSVLPRFRRRLSEPHTGGLSWPSWVQDDSFDVATHVRHAALPAPGGTEELLDWLGDFYSHRLDRAHPLWEMTLLDGLAEDRWAIAAKVHHCLIDGMSGASVTTLILDPEPDPDPDAKGLLGAFEAPPDNERDALATFGADGRGACRSRPRSSPTQARRHALALARAGRAVDQGRAAGSAADEPQRRDRRRPADGAGGHSAGRPQGDQAGDGRHRQRCCPCGLRRRLQAAAGVPRRGAPSARDAGDGPRERAAGQREGGAR